MPVNLAHKNYFILAMIVLIGLLAYSNSFSVPFQFDDDGYIVHNPTIRTFHYFLVPSDVTKLSQRSPESFPVGLRYAFVTRMVGYVSFAINYKLDGLNVVGYHLVNLLIHIISAMLLYLTVKATLKTDYFIAAAGRNSGWPHEIIAGASALLFVSHPIQTQAVTYISQRFASLAALFYLLSLFSYIKFRTSSPGHGRYRWYLTAIISAIFAMLTKEFTITLPIIVCLYEFTFLSSRSSGRIRVLAPYAAILLIIPAIVFFKQGTLSALDSTMRTITAADVTNIPRSHYLLTQFRVVVLYLRLLIFPINQNVDHDVAIYTSLLDLPVFLSFLFLLALFSVGVFFSILSKRKKEHAELRLTSFGIFWFFITLSVESSIIPLGELVAEYRLYLPSIGMILAFVSLLAYAMRKFKRHKILRPEVAYGLIGALVVVLAIGTYARNRVWASEISLWEDAAMKSPAKLRPHLNLGTYYSFQGRLEDAKREIMIALTLSPASPELHNNLGMIYRKMKAYDHAIYEYTTVLKLAPGDAIAHYNLGNVYLEQGRIPDAAREYQIAVRLIPDYDEAHNNLGFAYCESGQFDAAIREYNLALRLNPQNLKARNNLETCIRKAEASTVRP
jgi:tetratricopeptide (TPR) repeat protein